jgi:tRNA threonylcarbamoyladenosine biosynthesis protein TsaE
LLNVADAADHRRTIVEMACTSVSLKTDEVRWADEDATAAWATKLAQSTALANAFIALHGDLGAGKTTFVRHLLRALGVDGRIKSPTYAIVEEHQARSELGGWPILHFDFYRFEDPREWDDAGFRELFAGPGLKLAEWPEKAAPALPTPDLEIHIDTEPDGARTVRLNAQGPIGLQLIQACGA